MSGKAPSHAGEICPFNPTNSMDSTNSTDYSPEPPVIDLKEKLHEIAPDIFKGTPVMFAYLYGSYAGGVPHRFSDFDFLPVIQEYKKTYRDNALSEINISRAPCDVCRESFSKPKPGMYQS